MGHETGTIFHKSKIRMMGLLAFSSKKLLFEGGVHHSSVTHPGFLFPPLSSFAIYILFIFISLYLFPFLFLWCLLNASLSLSHINPRRQNRVHIIETIPSCVWLNFGYIFLFYSRKKKMRMRIKLMFIYVFGRDNFTVVK